MFIQKSILYITKQQIGKDLKNKRVKKAFAINAPRREKCIYDKQKIRTIRRHVLHEYLTEIDKNRSR